MNRLVMFIIVVALILTVVFVFRYLKMIPNYKNEYLLSLKTTKVLNTLNIEKVNGIYQVHQLSDKKYRIHFDASIEELKDKLFSTLSLTNDEYDISQIHSWLKTNAWK